MIPVCIVRHVAHEGPGYLATFLSARGVPYRVVRIDAGDPLPDTPAQISALVSMGGPMSANDNLPWIGQELALMRQAAAMGIPMLGHCLGAQLISKALGGRVDANPVKEIGWQAVNRLDNPQADAWLGGLPAHFEVFHWHGETFSIPSGCSPILESAYCTNQAFVNGNILALQCHIEMTEEMVRDWTARNADELEPAGAGVQDAVTILDDLDNRIRRLNAVADTIYGHWLRAVD